ncbi:hypothetical protein M7I_7295 [Glarea lozoyensis 74030]|uniref:Uncharacterized protein n=1 Tax=Glarea lozoyensis (strain ATCC 74030 / MF5533) TaxID=1104152 RepID=H0EWX0_GLAL7|nr:hypothetical protein M7I_7295 [Glarea lozoyensis 74030]
MKDPENNEIRAQAEGWMPEYEEIRHASKNMTERDKKTRMEYLLRKIEGMLRIYAETRGHAEEIPA